MANSDSFEAQRNELMSIYGQFSELEQQLAQLTSIIYAPVSKAQLLKCFNRYLQNSQIHKPLTTATLKPHLDRLIDHEIVVIESGFGLQCHPLLVEVITRDALDQGRFDAMVTAVQSQFPIETAPWNSKLRFFKTEHQLLREARIGLYRKDLPFIERQLEAYYQSRFSANEINLTDIFTLVCNNPFDREWFLTLKAKPNLYITALSSLCTYSSMRLTPADGAFALSFEELINTNTRPAFPLWVTGIEQLLLRGRLTMAEEAISRFASLLPDHAQLYQSWLSLLRGDYEQTIEIGRSALKSLQQECHKRKVYFDTLPGLFLVLALIKAGSLTQLQEAEQYAHIIAEQRYKHWLSVIYNDLEHMAQLLQGNQVANSYFSKTPITPLENSFSLQVLIEALCLYWADLEKARERLPHSLRQLYKAATAAGYDWVALEAATLLSRLSPKSKYGKQAPILREATGIQPLTDLITPKEPWELGLTALIRLNPKAETSATGLAPNQTDYRLVWFITLYSPLNWTLQPKEQKMRANGRWSQGRAIALKRLKKEQGSLKYLTPQDIDACTHLVPAQSYYSYDSYIFRDEVLLALVGHPLVFWEDSPTTRVELVRGEPALVVQQGKPGWLIISLNPQVVGKPKIALEKETPTRLKVVEFTPNHYQIAEVLGDKNRLEVPEHAKDQVLAAINAVSGLVMVHSVIGGGIADAEEVESHPQPHLHLLPAGSGLKVSLLTRPFGDDGPYYPPGAGGEMVIAEIEGKRLQTHRDLPQERALAQIVEQACPILQQQEQEAGEWLIADPEACLELLLDLQNLGDQVVVEWPEGETLRIAKQVGLNNFKLQIQQQRNWFAASGELPISDDQVLDMQRLLELLDASPSRFIKLDDGQFLALTEEFRKRLDDLRAFADSGGKTLRFHPLASLAMEDWIDDVGQLKTDKHWKAHVQRLKQIQSLQPELPSTLQAELRDYQITGFQWLARLAHWGVGACLADDMGLGKTLQALAVILTRAPAGPTLIVAPTSVCMNWISEAEKFAPTLNPIQFGSGDRQALLKGLQPFDLLVCSYGLLQQEDVAAMLAKVTWETIVLDEAQAIKNFATKRSKAAMQLQGGFKLITTGTPIENHLGELWNLFRFINPGLLGSQDQFNQKFANAIERQQDKQARNRLKKLIQPFMLRRTKTQVLEELPARTEITLQVELSSQEMAFYEALRRDAIAKLTDSEAAAGTKHLQVLAEIMRLRRACCNTRLVKPEAPLPSAKLEAFGEILEDLLGNQHKALVFSQFVDHLTILREFLEGQQVSYQYLDGSTPARDRKRRVDAFQAGEGDVFLISLKAGGTGLNLTAADYVIHMDPWWNPAVEDQASDRAHRIGQQRPVTIYRLVAKHTIEEKIVDLHRQKRDLADSLLEGTDVSGKMSTQELLQLISEG